MLMKKRTALAITGITLLSGLIIGGMTLNKSKATDIPPLVTEVQHQGEVLNNHETRIKNTENDVKDLQSKTSTPPSTNNSTPTQVITQSPSQPIYTSPTPTPTPDPTPAPIVVTAFEQIPVGDSEIDCKLTYSDGSSATKVWQTWEYNQGTKITHSSGYCDQRSIGLIKP
jgi:hypothetical protein